MNRLLKAGIPTLMVGLLSALPCFAQASLDGHWDGSAIQEGDEFKFMVDFRADAQGIKGEFTAPSIGVIGTALINIKYDPPKVHFELPPENGAFPFDGEVRDDKISGVWAVMGVPARFSLKRTPFEPPPYKQEGVRFRNGDVTLAGTLLLPLSKGPHPAVVFIHGSGPENLNAARFLADHFTRHGVASLIYDKRGVGSSTGDWTRASFSDLAGDALAGVRYLNNRREINHRQIGLRGGSQGGWLAPLAASRSKDIAFIIIVSAPAVPPWQQETYRVEAQTRAMGLPESEVAEAVALMRLKFEVAASGKGWEQLAAMMERARGKRWYPRTNPPKSLEALQDTWKREFSFNPVPILEKVTCPVLAIYGEADTSVQVKESVQILERALRKAGNKDSTIKVYSKADHAILVWPAPGGQSRWLRFAQRYIETVTDWLLNRVTVPK